MSSSVLSMVPLYEILSVVDLQQHNRPRSPDETAKMVRRAWTDPHCTEPESSIR